MKLKQPHTQAHAAAPNPIVRAVVLDVCVCALGLVLYMQTGSVVWPIACAIAGSALVIGAVIQMRRDRRARAATRKTQPRTNAARAQSPSSNVIPFKGKSNGKAGRSTSGDDNSKSNWPFA